jgi:hypothetical protein
VHHTSADIACFAAWPSRTAREQLEAELSASQPIATAKTRQWTCDYLTDEFQALFHAEPMAAGMNPELRWLPGGDADCFQCEVARGISSPSLRPL